MSTVRIQWHGPAVESAIDDAAAQGIAQAAEHLLGAARAVVPIEEGTLERSGAVSTDGLTAAVSFDTPYAVRQHEDLSFRHDPGRTAKYLENPAHEEATAMTDIVAAALRRATR